MWMTDCMSFINELSKSYLVLTEMNWCINLNVDFYLIEVWVVFVYICVKWNIFGLVKDSKKLLFLLFHLYL